MLGILSRFWSYIKGLFGYGYAEGYQSIDSSAVYSPGQTPPPVTTANAQSAEPPFCVETDMAKAFNEPIIREEKFTPNSESVDPELASQSVTLTSKPPSDFQSGRDFVTPTLAEKPAEPLSDFQSGRYFVTPTFAEKAAEPLFDFQSASDFVSPTLVERPTAESPSDFQSSQEYIVSPVATEPAKQELPVSELLSSVSCPVERPSPEGETSPVQSSHAEASESKVQTSETTSSSPIVKTQSVRVPKSASLKIANLANLVGDRFTAGMMGGPGGMRPKIRRAETSTTPAPVTEEPPKKDLSSPTGRLVHEGLKNRAISFKGKKRPPSAHFLKETLSRPDDTVSPDTSQDFKTGSTPIDEFSGKSSKESLNKSIDSLRETGFKSGIAPIDEFSGKSSKESLNKSIDSLRDTGFKSGIAPIDDDFSSKSSKESLDKSVDSLRETGFKGGISPIDESSRKSSRESLEKSADSIRETGESSGIDQPTSSDMNPSKTLLSSEISIEDVSIPIPEYPPFSGQSVQTDEEKKTQLTTILPETVISGEEFFSSENIQFDEHRQTPSDFGLIETPLSGEDFFSTEEISPTAKEQHSSNENLQFSSPS